MSTATVNLLTGPPSNPSDCSRMMSLFFASEGKHIICGGTTSAIAADYIGKPVRVSLDYIDPDIPPTACIEGVDLVTEGVITLRQVTVYALSKPDGAEVHGEDGASLITRMLFDEASEVIFFLGTAVNPICSGNRSELVGILADCLMKTGKKVKINRF